MDDDTTLLTRSCACTAARRNPLTNIGRGVAGTRMRPVSHRPGPVAHRVPRSPGGELSRDYLWRYARRLPGRGEIGTVSQSPYQGR